MDERNDKPGNSRGRSNDRGPARGRDNGGRDGNRGGDRNRNHGGDRRGGGGGYRGRDGGGDRGGQGGGYRGRDGGGDRGGQGGGYRGRDGGGDRPRRDFGDRPPRRDGDDRPPRRDHGDRPPRREFSDRPRRDSGQREDRPRRDFGDRPPRRDNSDRPPRRDGGGFRGSDRRDNRPDNRRDGRRDGGREGGWEGGRDGPPKDRREGRGHFRKTEGREPGRREREGSGPGRRPVSVEVRSGQRGPATQDAQHWIFGRHAVQAALANPERDIQRLVATEAMAEQAGISGHALLEKVTRPDMDHMLARYDASGTTHGGIAAFAANLTPPSIDALLKPEGRSVVVLLDQVSDPHNVGAIMRTAAAFGARAVIAPERNAAPVTGALAKSASGALETVPYLRPTNLARTLAMLKEWGYWRIGLDGNSDKTVESALEFERVALVLGSEGKGLRRLTGENCGLLVSIPMSGEIESLNVSNAAAIAMYRLFADKV